MQKEHFQLLFAELRKTVVRVCCISTLACVCVSVCVRVQCQLICFSFQQVKHTCESSSCCFEEGSRDRGRGMCCSPPFFLQPFSSPVSRLFCLLSSHSHLLNCPCLLMLVCICLLLSLGQQPDELTKTPQVVPTCF